MSDAPAPGVPDESADLEALHREHDLLASPAGGGLAGRLRGVLVRLLSPLLRRQSAFNAAAARLASVHTHETGASRALRVAFEPRLAQLREGIYKDMSAGLNAAQEQRRDVVEGMRAEMEALREELKRDQTRVQVDLVALRSRQAAILDGVAERIEKGLDRLQAAHREELERLREETLEAVRSALGHAPSASGRPGGERP